MKVKILYLTMFILFISTTVTFPQWQEEYPTLPKQNTLLQPNLQTQQLTSEIPVLEAPINPDEYIVGPGDVLTINLWSKEDALFYLTITPECKLLIPTVKDIDLNDLTLTQAKEKIKKAVMKKYINSDVSVNLVSLRTFRVTVSGLVKNPGTVVVSAADRVSEAIRLANILTTPVEEKKEDDEGIVEEKEVDIVSAREGPILLIVTEEPSKRHIVLTRRNGEKIPVDLQGYEVTGDKSKNPYLLEGDVIYVPIYTKNLPSVEILGAVHKDGIYELMEGDRVMDIIKLAHGFTYNADSSNIAISRFNADHKTTNSFKVDLSKNTLTNGGKENNVLLKPDDRVYVRYYPEYQRKHTAEIKGEIMSPGFYTIEYGKTRLSDVVRMAGGFTENASLKESFIIRRPYETLIDPEYERLVKTPVGDMTSIEKEYFKMKSRERKGRVEVDFVKLFVEGDSTEDILLRGDDYIEITRNSKVVQVSGKVKRPGLVPYKEGERVRYYVEQAGGYSWNARTLSVRIIRNETGDWIKANGRTKVYVGDTIFVPEKPEIKWWTVFRDVVQSAYVIASFIWMIDRIQEK
ncbi:MAG: SLBB domain-containing protein [Thermoplasmatales archaeon]|nr:MAG: SLBB domain-containing protein [Thermoplasmatales archaeon]